MRFLCDASILYKLTFIFLYHFLFQILKTKAFGSFSICNSYILFVMDWIILFILVVFGGVSCSKFWKPFLSFWECSENNLDFLKSIVILFSWIMPLYCPEFLKVSWEWIELFEGSHELLIAVLNFLRISSLGMVSWFGRVS